MSKRAFGVRLYRGTARGSEGESAVVSDMLHEIGAAAAKGAPPFQSKSGDELHEIRDLYVSAKGDFITGVLATLRPDAPHIREAGGAETPIPLKEGDRVLEKNHFIYYADQQVLAWQVNGRGSHVSRFEKHLTAWNGHKFAVVLDDILTVDAVKRLNEGIITRLDFRFAKPRNPMLYDPSNWESAALSMMSDADATKVSVSVSTKRKKGSGLRQTVAGAIHRLMDSEGIRKLEVKLRDVDDPIDLLAECLKGRISVAMIGLYPDEMPPINSATSNLVKSVFDKENGLEEAVFRRTDHRLFAAGGGWCSDQGTMPATRLQ